MLEDGRKYVIETSKLITRKSKDGEKDLQFLVLVGNIDGTPREYELSVWRIESEKPFDADKPNQKFEISRKGDNIFFSPLSGEYIRLILENS